MCVYIYIYIYIYDHQAAGAAADAAPALDDLPVRPLLGIHQRGVQSEGGCSGWG